MPPVSEVRAVCGYQHMEYAVVILSVIDTCLQNHQEQCQHKQTSFVEDLLS